MYQRVDRMWLQKRIVREVGIAPELRQFQMDGELTFIIHLQKVAIHCERMAS